MLRSAANLMIQKIKRSCVQKTLIKLNKVELVISKTVSISLKKSQMKQIILMAHSKRVI